ncbi:MAG: prepilin-type N-terminal cleavage/methylation domain-containing protein [Vicinamibacterales bacterium]
MRPAPRRHDAGFTLVELLISTAIMMIVTGAIFTVLTPSQRSSQAQPETADMQQRMRVGAETLFKELVMAGAGPYQGATTGSLVNFFAPIIPRRTGLTDPDPTRGTASVKTDAITLAYIPNSYSQTTISHEMPNVAAELRVFDQANCPKLRELCGFEAGMAVIVFDTVGNFDTFTITHVQDSAGHLQHRQEDLNFAYQPGAQVTQIESNTYYLNRATNQLMRYDGLNEDIALVDDVVDLLFEYFGDPQPPLMPKPPPGTANCLYDAVGAYVGPAALTPTDGSLAALPLSILSDGPYCGSGPNEFDADLLRIRKVRVTLRMQAAAPGLRGASTALFMNPGTAREADRTIADYRLTFEVSPRNLNLAR